MDILKISIAVTTVIIALAAFVKNRTLFTPVKIYLLFAVYFYGGVYMEEVRIETLLCYAALIVSIGLCIPLEPRNSDVGALKFSINFNKLYRLIWIFSLPAFATILFFIYEAGGLLSYIESLSRRVLEWKGQGHFVIILNTLPTLSVIYFVGIVVNKKAKRANYVLFALHLILFATVGLLTASRSYVAIALLMMVVMYNYLVRVVKIRYAMLAAIFLMVFVGIVGNLRNSYGNGLSAEGLWEVISGGSFENAQTLYGINPMEIIFNSNEEPLLYGATYLTLFTNVIPRSIWPDKPDTGGVIFTKIYTGDQWEGASYLATGAITEGVMNFGLIFGVLFGIFFNIFVMALGCLLYKKTINRLRRGNKIEDLLLLPTTFYILLAFARFSYGEFTDIFQSLIYFNILPIFLIYIGMSSSRVVAGRRVPARVAR